MALSLLFCCPRKGIAVFPQSHGALRPRCERGRQPRRPLSWRRRPECLGVWKPRQPERVELEVRKPFRYVRKLPAAHGTKLIWLKRDETVSVEFDANALLIAARRLGRECARIRLEDQAEAIGDASGARNVERRSQSVRRAPASNPLRCPHKKAAGNMPSGLPGSKFSGNKNDTAAAPVLLRLSAVSCCCEVPKRFRNQEQEVCCRQGTNISVPLPQGALAPIGQ